MKPKIFVTRLLPEPAMQKLDKIFQVTVNPDDRVLTKNEIMAGVKNCDLLLCLLTDTIDADIIAYNPDLKGIANYAVGYNNIDLAEATRRGIPVSNTPGVLTETTADHAWALLLAVSRKIVESDNFTRQGKFKGWGPLHFLGNDIYGKILGLIGTGRIGSAVARRASGFKMKILYHDQQSNSELEQNYQAELVPLDHLLANSDFVSLHVPLTEETRDMIGTRELGLMKPTAYLINTSRGKIVEEKSLVQALRENRIAGAALDVYYDEPDLSAGLTECSNAVLTSHIASATGETRTAMGMIAAENAIAMISGKKPPNILNPEIYHR